MNKLLLLFCIFSGSYFLAAQKNETELLKNVDSYIEKNIELGKWRTKYYLVNGLVKIEKTYWGRELRGQREFEYDRYGNQKHETETFNINDGKINKVSVDKLTYIDTILVSRETDYGLLETFSDFNQFGKPKLINRSDEFGLWPFKKILEYDKYGFVTKTIEFSYDLDDKSKIEKAITQYKYDKNGNVIEIHREFEPKKEFPVLITGGPHLFQFEYFRYLYNDNGLWTKKFKTVNGKEYLIAKRRYK